MGRLWEYDEVVQAEVLGNPPLWPVCEGCQRTDNPPYQRWSDDVHTCKDCSYDPSPPDVDGIEVAAKACEWGSWEVRAERDTESGCLIVVAPDGTDMPWHICEIAQDIGSDAYGVNYARYIATAAPATVLALTAEIRTLRAQLLEVALAASQPTGPADALEWDDQGQAAVRDAFEMLEARGMVAYVVTTGDSRDYPNRGMLWRVTDKGRDA